MHRRISRDTFLEFLEHIYMTKRGQPIGPLFTDRFDMGHDDPDIHHHDEQHALDVIQDRYVQPLNS